MDAQEEPTTEELANAEKMLRQMALADLRFRLTEYKRDPKLGGNSDWTARRSALRAILDDLKRTDHHAQF